jgi:mannan endo-1,4-beta-mannosidase
MKRRLGGVRVSADTERPGRHRLLSAQKTRYTVSGLRATLAIAIGVACVTAAVIVTLAVQHTGGAAHALDRAARNGYSSLPAKPDSYIGLYPDGVPYSFAGVTAFTTATGVKPRVVAYYSGWLEVFQTSFAHTVAEQGAVPLVQMDPTGVSIAAIASGRYDSYLSAYAKAVRAYHEPVILSFGHEMNGYWYSWGYHHTSPTIFVAAWRHIVSLFRALGALNVTWLWTVNTIHSKGNVPSPARWWPGGSYVTWIGIDGYYFNSSSMFASVFGPTIATVRTLTTDPILIAETAAPRTASQPSKVADLFAGVRLYGLLGFVWFDATHIEDWHLAGSAAIAAFRRGAKTYTRNVP